LLPLLLQDNRLEGTLPPSWGSGGKITKLVELGLYYNSLRGKQRLSAGRLAPTSDCLLCGDQ
jgi:hypothetical protein